MAALGSSQLTDNRLQRLSSAESSRSFALVRYLAERLEPIQQFIEAIVPIEIDNAAESEAQYIAFLSRTHPNEFARRFFWKNLVKCAISLVLIDRENVRTNYIVDLGCGPGTFTFPIQTLLPETSVIGIDRNLGQLLLAQHLSTLVPTKKPALFRATIPHDLVATAGLLTASYLAAEMSEAERDDFASFIRQSDRSAFLIVDYANVVESLYKRVETSRLAKTFFVSAFLPSDIARIAKDDQVSFGVLYVPYNEQQA